MIQYNGRLFRISEVLDIIRSPTWCKLVREVKIIAIRCNQDASVKETTNFGLKVAKAVESEIASETLSVGDPLVASYLQQ